MVLMMLKILSATVATTGLLGGDDDSTDGGGADGGAPENFAEDFLAQCRPGAKDAHSSRAARLFSACTLVSSGRDLVAPPGTLPGIQDGCVADSRANAGRRTDPKRRPPTQNEEGHKARHGTLERAVTGGGG